MIYIKICYLISLTILMAKGLYFLLAIMQEEHYHIKRYIKCFITYYFKKKYNYILYLMLLISLTNNSYLYIFGLVLSIIGLFFSNKLLIKLKFTKRIIRLLITYVLTLTGAFFLFSNITFFSFTYLFTPLLVILSYVINMPLEHFIKRHYVRVAKDKLNKINSLVKIAITGSFGKTSTKNIITSLVEQSYLTLKTPSSYNTLMGITKTINESLNKTNEVFVCELGATFPKEISKMSALIKPQIRIITDVGLQHISTFKTIENVLTAKFELLKGTSVGIINILNGDNELIRKKSKFVENTIYYGLSSNNDISAQNIKLYPKHTVFDLYEKDEFVERVETKLLGKHNVKNIICAYATLIALRKYNINISKDEFKHIIGNIEPTNHRLKYERLNNIHIYDNAYSSNIIGLKNSIEVINTCQCKKVIITPGIVDCGNMTKDLNEEVAKMIKDVFDEIYIIDNYSGRYIYNYLKYLDNVYLFKSFKEAYLDFLENNKSQEVALLIENDLPDNYLVRGK